MFGGKLEEKRRADELARGYYGDALRYAVGVMKDEREEAEDRKRAAELVGKVLREWTEPAGSGD